MARSAGRGRGIVPYRCDVGPSVRCHRASVAIDIRADLRAACRYSRARITPCIGIPVRQRCPAIIAAGLVCSTRDREPYLDLFVIDRRLGHAALMTGSTGVAKGDSMFPVSARRYRSGPPLTACHPVRTT